MNSTKEAFSPSKYLKHKINKCNCQHGIYTCGFDSSDGLTLNNYTCAICGYNINAKASDLKNSTIFTVLDNQTEKLIQNMLTFVANRYINETHIDIVKIFKDLQPNIEDIARTLSIPTETDTKLVLKKR